MPAIEGAQSGAQAGIDAPPAAGRSTLQKKPSGRFRRLLGEPLVHFFVVGALVFGAYWWHEPEAASDTRTIEISADDVRQIVVAWSAQGRSPLTEHQLNSLIDQKVSEEVLFREGQALGLDQNDEIIKRRVAQKMDFLAADVASLQEPEKAELETWYSAHADRFTVPAHMSFRQLYFSPDLHPGKAQDAAQAALAAIGDKAADSAEVAAFADPSTLRNYYSDTTPELMLKEFGPDFAAELFTLEPDGWRGPIQSGYGWHLIWIDSITPGRVPSFEEVEADVKSAWRDNRYLEIKQQALKEMRSLYTVVVPELDTIDMSNLLGTKPKHPISPEIIPQ